ncbi:hypothetical protein ACNAN0_02110 [Agrilactobacillus fermenti]|uniref:hypothetical protein n=1 Tax=Agrilactobacillus fermenti TaxID=2586909 RepID=UPI003A5C5A4B
MMILLLPLLLLISLLAPTQQANAQYGGYRQFDHFYNYNSVATINGTWGANLYQGNDKDRKFDRILPVGTQWRIYGYTKRSDGFYYWAGANNWIEADQAGVVVDNESDAILNVIAKYGDDEDPDVYWLAGQVHDGYWGDDFWSVKNMMANSDFKTQYVVYPDGSAHKIKISDPDW